MNRLYSHRLVANLNSHPLNAHPLIRYRRRYKLSQMEAAARVGVAQSFWSLLENGEAYASVRVARRIAAITGVSWLRLVDLGDSETVAHAGK